MDNFKAGSLEIVFEKAVNKTIMNWEGKSDDREPEALLTPYLNNVVNSLDSKELHVEFRKLEFMNSSTIPPIIQFIRMLDDNSIKTVMIYDKKLKWQESSFKALNIIAKQLKNAEVKGE